MKSILCLLGMAFATLQVLGQDGPAEKPAIDSFAVKHWIELGPRRAISNNGKYVAYSIENQPYHASTLIIRGTTTSWLKEFPKASMGIFSKDSKQYIFKTGDTLSFLLLGDDHPSQIVGVESYQEPENSKGEWIAWRMKGDAHELVLRNLLTSEEMHYLNVFSYAFNSSGRSLMLEERKGKDNMFTRTLQIAYPLGNSAVSIWSSEGKANDLSGFAMDTSGRQAVFMIQAKGSPFDSDANVRPRNQLWYYSVGMSAAVLKVEEGSPGVGADLLLHGPPHFSKNGNYIFFFLQPAANRVKGSPGFVNLDVWSYRDTILQCTQLSDGQEKSYLAEVPVNGNNVFQLLQDYESMEDEGMDYIVVQQRFAGDKFWLQEESNFLVSLSDGSRKLLKTKGYNDGFNSYDELLFSPGGGYLVYYDAGQNCNFFSYNIKTGRQINLSASLPQYKLAWTSEFDRPKMPPVLSPPLDVGLAGWDDEDKSVFIYDNYDIWKFDLSGNAPPIDLTMGYGRKHHIKFRIVNREDSKIIKESDSLLLMAFNMVNKQTGFYQCRVKNGENPRLLTMDRCFQIYLQNGEYGASGRDFDKGVEPLRASNCSAWIVKRQSAGEAPNYFLTADFKNFKALSNLQPQKAYNWLHADLINFSQADGTISQGVLYKPENFNPTRKYPVIITYYEQLSQRLYQFPTPDFTGYDINISWFVSHGYLVFTPDIYFYKGKPGYSAYNTVVGAAVSLSKLPYVNNKRIGINGHSFGGFLTNYIVTHSHLFAAAIEGAGTSDWISSSLQLTGVEGRMRMSRLPLYEKEIGNSYWERPDLYVENSPVFRANQVTTPLMIFHSKSDVAVPWEQAVELFIAMRRLDKKVWMLQYEGQDHGNSGRAAEDYTMRVMQFFDFYLKGSPPPRWMTMGIPSRLKGIEGGLDLDTSGRKP